jgi:flagellar protein FliO/FliZ
MIPVRKIGSLRCNLSVIAAALPLQALAQTASAPAAATPAGPSLLPMVLVLLLVLALIPVSMWLLKRMGAGTPASAAGMKVVAQLPLGPRERLVVVEAGDRWLVLGVTAASINRVASLPKGALPAAGLASGGFAQLLGAARRSHDA